MEPMVQDPELPRYTRQEFPAYRYLPTMPGLPHPTRDPEGHSYAAEEDCLPEFSAADWQHCQPYLYGIDLFNHGYWWEAHEALEAVWLAAGQESRAGLFVQGLIMLAAAQLKRFVGQQRGARILTDSAVVKLSVAEGTYLGIEGAPLFQDAASCLEDDGGRVPVIRLIF